MGWLTEHWPLIALILWKISDFIVNQIHPSAQVTSVLNWFIPFLRSSSGQDKSGS
jgi:hypothetical protein